MLIDGRDSQISDGGILGRAAAYRLVGQSLAGHNAGWLDVEDGGAGSLMTCLGLPRGT